MTPTAQPTTAQAVTTNAATTQPWGDPIQLCWGGVFRVVGLAENSNTAHWWNLDGTPIISPAMKTVAHQWPFSDRQFCWEVYFDADRVKQGNYPRIKIDGVNTGLGIVEPDPSPDKGPIPHPWILREYHRLVFAKASATKLTIRGEVEDGNFVTFAIAKPHNAAAGPLTAKFSSDQSGKAEVSFIGDLSFPHEISAINNKGNRVSMLFATSSSGLLGNEASATFDCALSDIHEVHLQLCGVQRFVISDVAADPDVRTSPRVRIEHIQPTLNGHGPIWAGKLPEYQWIVDARAEDARNSSERR